MAGARANAEGGVVIAGQGVELEEILRWSSRLCRGWRWEVATDVAGSAHRVQTWASHQEHRVTPLTERQVT